MSFRGLFHEPIFPRITGFNKQGGEFWIGFMNDDDTTNGMIRIELTVPSDDSLSKSKFASIQVHYDSVRVIHKLSEIGFLDLFEEIQATTFYDVVQCCARCDIPIQYNGESTKEMTPRRIYDLLYLDAN